MPIQELANPLVAPFLDFYPEETNGCNQFKLSQSKKWLEMPPDVRTQMCVNNTNHFYIFEPVQTQSEGVVVPIFFYIVNEELCAKCFRPTYKAPSRFIIPGSIGFSHPYLVIINVKQFLQEYSKIKINGQLLLIICENKIYESENNSLNPINLPNSWRTIAAGMII
jgi:hypothetical protein